jgi:hypothetical protein
MALEAANRLVGKKNLTSQDNRVNQKKRNGTPKLGTPIRNKESRGNGTPVSVFERLEMDFGRWWSVIDWIV